ncbi:MAG: class I SAM-dependent methyltransferase [Elusimicrobia bacterium]|nr:class I SAM-dependent methyltransferase [Elusimicrobiota bacterium]
MQTDSLSDEKITPHTTPGVNEKAISLLLTEPRGKILDAPAAEGYGSQKLKELNFEVYACDINEKDFKLKGVNFKKADLNREFPYPKDFFDYVYCIEGIEHLENPFHLLREFSRVTKPGGKIIISTPNILSVYGRLRYLFLGYPDYAQTKLNMPWEGSPLEQHIHCVPFPELNYILNSQGFVLETVSTNTSVFKYYWSGFFKRIAASLVMFFFGIIIKLVGTVLKKRIPLSEILLSKALLFGEVLIIKARKK